MTDFTVGYSVVGVQRLHDLGQIRQLPRNADILIRAAHDWRSDYRLAGLVGLCAARGYRLVELPPPSVK